MTVEQAIELFVDANLISRTFRDGFVVSTETVYVEGIGEMITGDSILVLPSQENSSIWQAYSSRQGMVIGESYKLSEVVDQVRRYYSIG